MDVLQIFGKNALQKMVPEHVAPTDAIAWAEVLGDLDGQLPPQTPLVPVDDVEILAPELLEGSELVEGQQDALPDAVPEGEMAEKKPNSVGAVSVQEFTTTFENDVTQAEELRVEPAVEIKRAQDRVDVRLMEPDRVPKATVPETLGFAAREPRVAPIAASASKDVRVKDASVRIVPKQAVETVPLEDAAGPVGPVRDTKGTATRLVPDVVHARAPEEPTLDIERPVLPHDAPKTVNSMQGEPKLAVPPEKGVQNAVLDLKSSASNERVIPLSGEFEPRLFAMDIRSGPSEFAVPSMAGPTSSPIQAGSVAALATVSPRDQPVVFQVLQAIDTAETGKIELRLDPAELGKVRIVMSARDGVMLATIAAERPETLDLLRRNSESLDLSLADQGFGERQLSFEQFDQHDQSDQPSDDGYKGDMLVIQDTAEPSVSLTPVSDGLDIKL